ncbi:hypothetical protein BN128_2309 [Cronobacter sakazakii 696]|nr:hypothetical protein BN128_2309 [Cronobacter sakazakii 696]
MQAEFQTIHQTEEIGVAVGGHASGTAGHEVIGFGVRVVTEFRDHIGVRTHVIQDAVVTTVIDGAQIGEFQARKSQTGFGGAVRAVAFHTVSGNLIFPLAETGQLIVNLGRAFEAQTDIRLITVYSVVIAHIMFGFNTAIKIQLVAVLVINFCGLSSRRRNNTHHH